MFGTASFKCAGDSHAGLERSNNEDRFYLNPQLGIFLVVDGVGGQAAGEVAADIAVRVLRARLERQIGAVRERLVEGVTLANNEIYRLAQENPDWTGMACVLTAAVIEAGRATIGHVGDTRLYKIHNSQIKKITNDHSPVGQLEDAGQLSEVEAMAHPRRNEVLRDVGSCQHTPDDENFIDIIEAPFEPDCAVLLCSDGLSDLVTSEQILHVVKHNAGSRSRAVRQLIELANGAGGKDNITALLIEGEQFAAKLRKESRKPSTTAATSDQTILVADSAPQTAPTIETTARPRLRSRILRHHWTHLFLGLLIGTLIGIALVNFRHELLVRSPKVDNSGFKVHFVDKNGSAGFVSIGEALKQANPGDTIVVAPGDYAEPIRLKEGVTLVSQVSRQAVLRLGADSTENVVANADKINSGRLAGFRIEGASGPYGIGLQIRDSHLEVDDLEISDAGFAGISISGASTATLRTSHVHDNDGSGIVISDRATPRILQNRIVNNGQRTPTSPEIDILQRGQPELSWNVISGNGIDSISGLAVEQRIRVLETNFFRPRELRQSVQGTTRTVP
jgi:PPM family protein phosphatase